MNLLREVNLPHVVFQVFAKKYITKEQKFPGLYETGKVRFGKETAMKEFSPIDSREIFVA
jgi:hypothetical protein